MSDEKKTDSAFDPASLMENAFLMGVGVFEMTREKTQEMAGDLIERGKMSKSEAKRVADKLGEIAEEQQGTLRKTVAEETDKVLKTTGVATRDEIAELKAQIAELKAMIAGGAPDEPTE